MNGTADEWYQIRTLQEWGEWCYLASEETKRDVAGHFTVSGGWWTDPGGWGGSGDDVPPQFKSTLKSEYWIVFRTPAGEYLSYCDHSHGFYINGVDERAVADFIDNHSQKIADYLVASKGVEATINWLRQFNDKTR